MNRKQLYELLNSEDIESIQLAIGIVQNNHDKTEIEIIRQTLVNDKSKWVFSCEKPHICRGFKHKLIYL